MHKKVFACLAALAASPCFAQDLPPSSDFYYCAHFYNWFNTQLKDPSSSLKGHLTSSHNLFKAGAVVLSNGSWDKAASDVAVESVRSALLKARDENMKMGELFKSVDDECWSKQRRFSMAILKKSREIGAAQEPFFSHSLSQGQVDATEIAKRQEFIKAQPGVSLQDAKELTVYSFSRTIADVNENAVHAFTKEGNPAHPGVIFISFQQKGKEKPTMKSAGSYAGSKKDFDDLYTAFVLMNQKQ